MLIPINEQLSTCDSQTYINKENNKTLKGQSTNSLVYSVTNKKIHSKYFNNFTYKHHLLNNINLVFNSQFYNRHSFNGTSLSFGIERFFFNNLLKTSIKTNDMNHLLFSNKINFGLLGTITHTINNTGFLLKYKLNYKNIFSSNHFIKHKYIYNSHNHAIYDIISIKNKKINIFNDLILLSSRIQPMITRINNEIFMNFNNDIHVYKNKYKFLIGTRLSHNLFGIAFGFKYKQISFQFPLFLNHKIYKQYNFKGMIKSFLVNGIISLFLYGCCNYIMNLLNNKKKRTSNNTSTNVMKIVEDISKVENALRNYVNNEIHLNNICIHYVIYGKYESLQSLKLDICSMKQQEIELFIHNYSQYKIIPITNSVIIHINNILNENMKQAVIQNIESLFLTKTTQLSIYNDIQTLPYVLIDYTSNNQRKILLLPSNKNIVLNI